MDKLDNMDKLLHSVADEANEGIPYAAMKLTILEKTTRKWARRNRAVRYGGMAAALVVLLGVGAFFLRNAGLSKSNEMGPRDMAYGRELPNGDSYGAESDNIVPMTDGAPELMMSPPGSEAIAPTDGVEAAGEYPEPGTQQEDNTAYSSEVRGDSKFTDAGNAVNNALRVEYIGVLSLDEGISLQNTSADFIINEIYSNNLGAIEADVTIEVIDMEQPCLEVGWAMLNLLDPDVYIATWRATSEQYVVLTAPRWHTEEEVVGFLKASLGQG